MIPAPSKVDNSEYTVGWIAALPHERAAAQAMLDRKHAPPQQKHANDHNTYSLGSITGSNGEHNVAIASLPFGRYGTTSAATVATHMLSSFPNIKFGLMVGIGGGIPSDDNDIRLGDVVVSKPEGTFGGVRQYNSGKATTHGFEERGQLNSPPQVLLNAMGALVSKYEMEESDIPSLLEAMGKQYPKMVSQAKEPGYVYQGAEYDRLFEEDYAHDSSKKDCDECDPAKMVKRQERYDQNPLIHYGTIASGDEVIKDARKRGLYAAATAAAYAKELLQITDVAETRSTPCASDVMDKLKEIKSITKDIVQDRKRQDVFRWLTTLNPSSRHLESQKRRVEGTGRWMLEDPKFVQWSSATAKCKTLCCYGAAGAGKTIISSLVIDRLKERSAATKSSIGLAYVYCDYRDQKEQSLENILGAVLKQLLGLLPEIPETILKVYDEQAAHQKSLSSADAVDLLHTTCAQFSKTYVCLDALDEFGDLRGLLIKLRDSPSSMQIFLTGRQHIQGTVQEYFNEENIIPIEARENDIRLFCEHEIGGDNDLEPDAMDEELRKVTLRKVTKSAEGVLV
ncbi:nucleoside phosphorylase domain-containing protein [Bipolaris maydis]|nr:nucleoside phosphorylase domain-containing protein [Bipolaris maydis]